MVLFMLQKYNNNFLQSKGYLDFAPGKAMQYYFTNATELKEFTYLL